MTSSLIASRREEDSSTPPISKLAKSPISKKWFSLDGQKTANDFTATEGGSNKHVCSKHKIFWDTVDKMIDGDYTAQVLIKRDNSVYGLGQYKDIKIEIDWLLP